jgi:hypothetical protein
VAEEIPNPKSQNPNNIELPKFKTARERFWSFGNWNFGFVWDLAVGIWNFRLASMESLGLGEH